VTGRILVVDDDSDLRETLQMLLEQHGFLVTTAPNGRAALDCLLAGPRPDLVLLDLMMPDMNGWQFFEAVRAEANLASIPIVIMTAHRAKGDLPFENVLYKPFDGTTLLAAIARHAPSMFGGEAQPN
jgi:CheY-like chemotaxis protein